MKKQEIDHILVKMLDYHRDVSDLNFTVGKPMQVESAGELIPVDIKPQFKTLSPFQTEILALNLINQDRRLTKTLLTEGSCDLSYSLPGKARFRINIFSQGGNLSIVLRKLESKIPTIQERNLPETMYQIATEKNGLVFITGATGSGKTICTLTSTLEYALENNKKIVYTTRTNAQQRQVILELREIRDKMKDGKDKIFGVGIQGRANMCILARDDPDFASGTAEELSKLCSNEKKKAKATKKGKDQGCIYYRNFIGNKEKVDRILEWAKEDIPTAEEFIEYCGRKKICPYELNKLLVRETSLIIVPYIYVFDMMIRNMLFDWLSVPEEDVILVVDEAHNLPNYIRDLFSAQLSVWMLNSCVSEAEAYFVQQIRVVPGTKAAMV